VFRTKTCNLIKKILIFNKIIMINTYKKNISVNSVTLG
jgi:hypothetical protein